MRSFLLLIFFPIWLAAAIPYQVEFQGIEDSGARQMSRSISQLVQLKGHPPSSLNGLRYRAEGDLPEIIKVMHAFGYYEATAAMKIEEVNFKRQVRVQVHAGPLYCIESYATNCDQIVLQNLDLHLGEPANAQKLLVAEQNLLQLLSEYGYPLAKIEEREAVADGKTKSLRIRLNINSGPLCRFGPLLITGAGVMKERFFRHKIAWKQNEIYDSKCVEMTQIKLMESGLFSSVLISHDEPCEDNSLPMRLEVTETKPRSINVGASYQTFYGFGLTFGWEHRNIHGLGRKLSLQGDITQRSHSGTASYLVPDFRKAGEDFLTSAEAMREDIFPYTQRSYSATSRIEKKFKESFRAALGARVEKLFVTDSVENGQFFLAETPIYFRWSNANDLLNPTCGHTFEYTFTPSINCDRPGGLYLVQKLGFSHYVPLHKKNIVFAQKLTAGSILSHHMDVIPVPKRFLGGSEEDLRGYRYRSVSHLSKHHHPTGGRSAIFYTVETRFQVTKSIGLVPFFDLGQVKKLQVPPFVGKWFKSAGLGLRYFSFVGPIRIDLAFPLDRREEIDPTYRILVSIGQMF